MKYASSIKYGGQLVDAIECDHDDYKRLGLLCPECKDPVFLRAAGTRLQKGKEVKISAYFSHFPGKDPTLVQQCENRVNKYTPKELQRMAAQARGQRLKLLQRWFWTVFVDSLLLRHQKKSLTSSDENVSTENVSTVGKAILSVRKGETQSQIVEAVKKWATSVITTDRHTFKTVLLPNLFDVVLLEIEENHQDVKKPYKHLWSLDRKLHLSICDEIFVFLCSRKSDDLFSDVIAFVLVHLDPEEVQAMRSSIKRPLEECLSLFVIISCIVIPWADEFAKLEKPMAPKLEVCHAQ